MKAENNDIIKAIELKVKLGSESLTKRKEPLELEIDDKLDTDCNIRNRGKWEFGG